MPWGAKISFGRTCLFLEAKGVKHYLIRSRFVLQPLHFSKIPSTPAPASFLHQILMASSSSSSKPKRNHDVFLSFRGTEIHNTFLNLLYAALHKNGLLTYIDSEELRKGEGISEALMKAIEESRAAIIVFSEDYPSSPWCLEEVAKIMECKEQRDLVVFPVFYKVDPPEVRGQRQSYGEAMAMHEIKFGKNSEKVKRWKKALVDAGSLSGWHFTDGYDAGLIQHITQEISTQLDRMPLDVAKFPIGIDSRVEELKAILNLQSKEDVLIVGLWGQGGLGKTTLAKAIYNAVFRDFQGSSFLERVRENSKNSNDLVPLQEKLLSDVLLGKKLKVFSVGGGSRLIQDRLCNKKALIILDDVDDECQLNALAGDCAWFGQGSRIIITSRNKHLLTSHGVDWDHMYEVKALENVEALELFRKHAFLGNRKAEISSNLVDRVVHNAKGLPLALEVLGSFLCGRGEHEWKSTLKKLSKIPDKNISDVLKVSYDGLENYVKEIFLDIACFFKGRSTEYIKKVLGSCDFEMTSGVQILIDRSLIREEYLTLQMHDLIQLMGMDIVKEECRDDLGKRSRLWLRDDVLHVLSGDLGTTAVKAIVLELSEQEEMYIGPDAFKNMRELRLLILCNVDNAFPGPIHLPNELRWFEWPHCASIPEFSNGPKKLVGLDAQNTNVEVLLTQFKDFKNLKYINLSKCQSLVCMPDLACTPNLEELDLHECKNLELAHESVAYHGKLQSLNLSGCSKLYHLPDVLKCKKLQSLNLNHCSKLQRFPDIPHQLEGLQGLRLKQTSIEELPASIENLVSLEHMNLNYCKKLAILPSSIYRLQNLKKLTLQGCSKLIKFPKEEEDSSDPHMKMGFPQLQYLNLSGCNLPEVEFLENHSYFPILRQLLLSGNNFTNLPTFGQLYDLLSLDVSYCPQLQGILEIPRQLRKLLATSCVSLSKISSDICDVDTVNLSSCHELVRNGFTVNDVFNLEQFHPKTGCQVLLPGRQMPEWLLPHKQGYIAFKATKDLYKKFLGLAFCVVFRVKEGEKSANFELLVYVNGKRVAKGSRTFISVDLDHVWLEYWDLKLLWEGISFGPNDCSRFQFIIRASGGGIVERYGFRLICMPLEDNLEVLLHGNELLAALLYEVCHEDSQISTKEESSSETKELLDIKTSTEKYSSSNLVQKGSNMADFSLQWRLEHEENHTSTEEDSSSETEDLKDSQKSTEKDSSSKSLNKGLNMPDFSIEVQMKDEAKERVVLIGNSYRKSPHAAIEYLVGIDKQVEDMMDLLDLEVSNVRIVGIWGKGGVGKTTLAKVIFEQISSRFDSCSFLPDIAETAKQLGGVQFLQSKLMSDILKQDYEVDHVAKGVNFFKEVLRNMKVLIILDDVEVRLHLHEIVGEKLDWFGDGSRIIVTTSFTSILPKFITRGSAHDYKINMMNNDQALELFRKHALPIDLPIPGYDEAAIDIINCVNGIPLLIEVIGSLLDRNLVEKLIAREEPILQFGLRIQEILMVSYEELSEVQREIFLDIACLPADVNCRIASFMWHNPHFPLSDGVDALHVKSLVKIGRNNELGMHRLLREFGQQIIRTEDRLDPERRGRLCNLELAWNTEKMEGTQHLNFDAEDFKSMPNIRFLILDRATIAGDFSNVLPNLKWLQWQGCTSDFKATNFHTEKLAILDLSWSKVTEDWGGWRGIKMPQLKVLNLTGCADLLISPDLSSFPDLEILILERCSQLIKLDPSIRHLKYLTCLNLRFCNELNMLPVELGHLKALKELFIDGTSVQEIPVSMGHMEKLEIFTASNCLQLSHLPDSLWDLRALSVLLLDNAKITQIPDSLGKLGNLQHLSLKGCRWIERLPASIRNLERLEQLDITGTGISKLPDSFSCLRHLRVLKMDSCFIRELPREIGNLANLEELHASHCKSLKGAIPTAIKSLVHLRILKLGHSSISGLPLEIISLSCLQTLDLRQCNKIQALPELPSSLTCLRVSSERMKALPDLKGLVKLEEICLGDTDPKELICTSTRKKPRSSLRDPLVVPIGLPKLKILELSHSKITNLAFMHGSLSCTHLKKLVLSGVNLQEVSELPLSLSVLSIQRCLSLKRLPEVGHLRRLSELNLIQSAVEEIKGLEGLIALEVLNISYCEIKKLNGLGRLRALRSLILSDCDSLDKLPDISSLKMLNVLEVQRCRKIHDIEGLMELTNLTSLEVLHVSECEAENTQQVQDALKLVMARSINS